MARDLPCRRGYCVEKTAPTVGRAYRGAGTSRLGFLLHPPERALRAARPCGAGSIDLTPGRISTSIVADQVPARLADLEGLVRGRGRLLKSIPEHEGRGSGGGGGLTALDSIAPAPRTALFPLPPAHST